MCGTVDVYNYLYPITFEPPTERTATACLRVIAHDLKNVILYFV